MTQIGTPQRIAILGNAGTGKSRLAEQLGRRFGLPVFHLDRELWEPGWKIVDEDEFARRHRRLLSNQSWVIEGIGYVSTVPARIAAADLVIVTRYPLWRSFWWSLKRELQPRDAAGRPEGCGSVPIGKLIHAIWQVHRHTLPRIQRLLEKRAGRTELLVLRSPAEIPALLAG